MKRIIYPLIACSLITIVPFLLTFEKGQDIIRGLFGYELFTILLFLTFIKEHLKSKTKHQSLMIIMFILLTCALFTIAWIDLQNLLAEKQWNTNWYGILPFATCSLAIVIIWSVKSFKFNTICIILLATLIVHLAAQNQYATQPLAQFSIIDYLGRIAPKPVQRKEIADNFKNKYIVTDSASITQNYVDTTRSNIIILIESWGVPLDIKRFERQLKNFDSSIKTIGIHNRMYSRTRTAEREDLIYKILRDSGQRDTIFLPEVFANKGYKTTFLFGGDSLTQWRYKYIRNIGFAQALYGTALNDSTMIIKIDSILADTTQKHFIVWSTRDTQFPLDESEIYNSNANKIDSIYSFRLNKVLFSIKQLIFKNPQTRFIIQGDHNPILSPIQFQEKFYKRWVPFIIIN